ncbi:MAG TPA: thioesterase family protein [Flavobacteriales bacterium]|jgi:acyl-CoA thioester hydrolase
MFQHSISLRVRYAETDRMGYVYYGNYATYFEVARVETLRELGITYKSLEDEGVLLPVADYSIRYHKPAFYDDHLTIVCYIPQLPTARIKFEYKTFRGDELLNTASTDLVFVDKTTGKPMRCPQHVLKAMEPFFTEA